MLDASSHNFAFRQSSVATPRRCTSRSSQNRGSAGIHAIRSIGRNHRRSKLALAPERKSSDYIETEIQGCDLHVRRKMNEMAAVKSP